MQVGLYSRDGAAQVDFDREDTSLKEVIWSAVAQAQTAGLATSKVELDGNAVASSGA